MDKAKKYVSIKQVGSPIRRDKYQRSVLIGLGLNKLNRVVSREDTPAIRGMINAIAHLVEIQKVGN